jgi:hypothetical protein
MLRPLRAFILQVHQTHTVAVLVVTYSHRGPEGPLASSRRILVRGNQRLKTFLDRRDYQAYLERLAKYRKQYGYSIHAYCLMPNHYLC